MFGTATVRSFLLAPPNRSLPSRPFADFRKHSHETWGRRYEVKDVKVEWHVATPAEIDFVLELLRELVLPALDKLDALLLKSQQEGKVRSMEWVNDFCRVRSSSLPFLVERCRRC